MKVTIELETAEEHEMFDTVSKFVHARSTAIFFRREMVPLNNHQTGVPVDYKEKLYIEVALDSIKPVEATKTPLLKGQYKV